MARLVAFSYYGGKSMLSHWLLPKLPKTHLFCEPFCGSAAITLNREPSKIEIINDTNQEVVNFFKVLRDHRDEFIDKLQLTPFAKDEFILALEPTDEPIERARRFFIKIRQSYGASPLTVNVGDWVVCKSGSRESQAITTARSVDKLELVANRLRLVVIDNRPAIETIIRYDSKDALFYCDPPYVTTTCDTTKYGQFAMTDRDHRELAETLYRVKGKVALSGMRCDLYDDLYRDWHRQDKEMAKPTHKVHDGKARTRRVDSLWTNYEI